MRTILFSTAASLAVLASAPAHATVVFGDNFDSYNQSVPWTGGTNWSVGPGDVDLVTVPNGFALTCAGGSGGCVDLTGSTPGTLKSKLLTLNAGSYSLSFDYSGNQLPQYAASPFTASIAGLGTVTFNTVQTDSFTTYASNFVLGAPTATNLVFQQLGNVQFVGNIIDNVSLSAIPEPAAWATMIGGLFFVGGAYRRRRATAMALA
ncbi:MAG: PEPxxWA-CTERM sorting domain-containing protein [Sphingomonadaceae bacterium]|nr:PEPxxWA-CTERM sorting domain-containing protein [Sphingomonadaceae bacterium]